MGEDRADRVLKPPAASTPVVRRRMQAVRHHDTAPELALRRELHRRGLRYRVGLRVLPRRSIDVAFPRQRIAIFVDGCYWHGCPAHGVRTDGMNAGYWREKIERNRRRDDDTDTRLRERGWHVIRVWEHEDVFVNAEQIERLVRGEPGVRSP